MKPSDKEFLVSLLDSVYSKAMLLNWNGRGKDDIFRELYEILIDAKTRRKIGEYYTPLWLVEYMVDKMSQSIGKIENKIVLDPFCGSGTFLVASFHKKVQEGEEPDTAIREIIGFDINPLAVSIARAELMIAYKAISKGTITPLIFNIDSASLLLHTPGKWESVSFIDELRELEKRIQYVDSPIFTSTHVDFSEILRIEMILRECFREASDSGNIEQTLSIRLKELKMEKWKGPLTSEIVNTIVDDKNISAIARLIEKYGNGVWAVSITSLFAPHIIRKVKVDVVITNPPWAQLTEPKGSYGELIRSEAKQLLEGYEKSGQILAGSDISSILLYGCTNIARLEVAFLMPDEVVYTIGSHYGLGKVLTYIVAREFDGDVTQVKYDAFQHGRLPCIILLNKARGKVLCHSMEVEWEGVYSKALHLSDVKFKIKGKEPYGKYMEKVLGYTKMSAKTLEKKLTVDQINQKGNYIMGLFGGTKKKGAKSYAGLVFYILAEDKTTKQYSIKLHGLKGQIKMQEFFIEPFWKKLIYGWAVFPFYIDRIYDLLLSSAGKEKLEDFLKTRVFELVGEDEKEKVETLIKEFKQPEKPEFVKKNKYYVIYRGRRTFASCVLTPSDVRKISENSRHPIILEDNCSTMITSDKSEAYYYSALLNYLAWKVIENGGVFERAQYLRPLIAIQDANLEWRKEEWQMSVSRLGKKLHQEASKCFANFLRKGIRIDDCLKQLKTFDGSKKLFETLIKAVDENVDESRLRRALGSVCRLT